MWLRVASIWHPRGIHVDAMHSARLAASLTMSSNPPCIEAGSGLARAKTPCSLISH